jgi:hypothetical protein
MRIAGQRANELPAAKPVELRRRQIQTLAVCYGKGIERGGSVYSPSVYRSRWLMSLIACTRSRSLPSTARRPASTSRRRNLPCRCGGTSPATIPPSKIAAHPIRTSTSRCPTGLGTGTWATLDSAIYQLSGTRPRDLNGDVLNSTCPVDPSSVADLFGAQVVVPVRWEAFHASGPA